MHGVTIPTSPEHFPEISVLDDQPPNEYTALLPKPAEHSDGESRREVGCNQVLSEFLILLRGSTPVIFAYILQNSLQTVSTLIVGRFSPEHLATAAFAYMFATASAFLIAFGGTTALDTLASSTFTGSTNRYDLGILLQRSLFVLGLFYIPVAALWIFSEQFFLLLGQGEDVSRETGRFLTAMVPGGLGFIYFETMKKYLQAQGIMKIGTYVLCITSPLNALLTYVFCHSFEMHLLGAPLAMNISIWLSFFILVLYAALVPSCRACWPGFSRAALQNLWTFSRLALLGIVQVGAEFWAFEFVALAAGRLGTIPLAAQSVILTADQVLNTIPFGISVATSARVGNLLGAQNPRGAARASHTAALLATILATLIAATLLATRHDFARLFNEHKAVACLTASVMPWVALFQVADGLNGAYAGALRGMGRQHAGALVNVVSYYAVALPVGVWLAFGRGWGLEGLWAGQCAALVIVGGVEGAVVAWSRWEREVERAFERMD